MIVGYNHNVRYKGLLFHIQTEDGGEKNPCVTSHIFYKGNVITSRKSNYRHLLYEKDREESVRKIMQDQHKATIKALVAGEFDQLESMKHLMSTEGKKEEQPKKSSVYQIYNPEGESEKLDIQDGKDDKSLDEMILEYLSQKED